MTDQLLLDVPDRIETERLIIRILQAGDGPMIVEAINESVDELCVWLSWACGGQDLETSEKYARHMQIRFMQRQEFGFGLFERESGRYLGNAGLHVRKWKIPSFEIGYWLRTSAYGHGYMTEAVRALTDYGFEQLGAIRIEIRADKENKPSAAVASRAGYILEGTLRAQEVNYAGEARDMLIFSKIRVDLS